MWQRSLRVALGVAIAVILLAAPAAASVGDRAQQDTRQCEPGVTCGCLFMSLVECLPKLIDFASQCAENGGQPGPVQIDTMGDVLDINFHCQHRVS